MSDKIHLSYVYQLKNHLAGDADTEFYKSIPDTKLSYRDYATNKPETPRRDAMQNLSVIGSAILSSTVLATLVKSYLQNQRTKLKFSADKSKVSLEYEGPNLKDSEEEICKALNQLIANASSSPLHVKATKAKKTA